MNCAMVCGSTNIWPLPTIKTTLGTQSLTFQSHLITLDIVTKFDEARETLQRSFNIFEADLRSLEGSRVTAGAAGEEVCDRCDRNDNPSKKNGKDCDIKKLDVRIEISTIKEVHLHLDMDESYELKINRKSLP